VISSYNTGANIARHSSILFGCNHLTILFDGAIIAEWLHDLLACRDDICNVVDDALEDDDDVGRDAI
jgi:hypothetical protein